MLTAIGRFAKREVAAYEPWTDVYGSARTLLALGTAGTLFFSHTDSIFRPAVGLHTVPICTGLGAGSLFCLLPAETLEVARWVAIAGLLLVASGWRPRLTGILHWWIAASLMNSATLTDGGDQVTQVITTLLLPVTLTDPRTSHWARAEELEQNFQHVFAVFGLFAIRVQVAGIYLHAATAKLRVDEWVNGTAVYYWFTDPVFGAPAYLQPLVRPLLWSPTGVVALTWGAMAIELFLFAGIFATARTRAVLLVVGIMFHGLIGLLQGLPSFSLAMWGALILYLRPTNRSFDILRLTRHLRQKIAVFQ